MRLVLAALPLVTLLLPIAAAQAQAPGSYRGSCTNITQDGPILSARCRGAGGNYSNTSINVDQCRGQPVANMFGRLACGNVRGSSEPAGGYDRPRHYDDQNDDTPPPPRYRRPPPPRYDDPPQRYDAPPRPGYDRPNDPYAPPRPRRYDPDQDY